jgi:DNA-binding transcriptional regulator YdaS (Cro superfamily)
VISNAIMLSTQGLYARLGKACEEAGGQSAWARRHGLSPQFVCDVVNGRRDPGPKMCRALGVAEVTMFKVIGDI